MMIWIIVGFMVGGLTLYLLKDFIFKKKPEEVIQRFKTYEPTVIEKTVYKNNKGYEFARQKIADLQDQLDRHERGVQRLHPTDVVRYTAMVEVLTQVLQ